MLIIIVTRRVKCSQIYSDRRRMARRRPRQHLISKCSNQLRLLEVPRGDSVDTNHPWTSLSLIKLRFTRRLDKRTWHSKSLSLIHPLITVTLRTLWTHSEDQLLIQHIKRHLEMTIAHRPRRHNLSQLRQLLWISIIKTSLVGIMQLLWPVLMPIIRAF